MKIEAALGFCARAGKIKSGDFAASEAVKKGKAALVIIDTAASDNTAERWKSLCAAHGIPLLEIENVGAYVGKRDKIIFAVTDADFGKLIREADADASN